MKRKWLWAVISIALVFVCTFTTAVYFLVENSQKGDNNSITLPGGEGDPDNPGGNEDPDDPDNPGGSEDPDDPDNPGGSEDPVAPDNTGAGDDPVDPDTTTATAHAVTADTPRAGLPTPPPLSKGMTTTYSTLPNKSNG